MAIRRSVINILIFIIYLAIGIPILSRILLPMVIDWIMNWNSPFLEPEFCAPIYTIQNSTLVETVHCTGFSLRPLILFLIQALVYVVVPIVLVFNIARR